MENFSTATVLEKDRPSEYTHVQKLRPRQYANIVALAAAVLFFKHSIFKWLMITFLVSIYILWKSLVARTTPISPVLPTPRKFSFLTKDRWLEEVSSLTADQDFLAQPAIKDSMAISQALSNLADSILREFVDSWFTKISQHTLFQDSIRLELKHVFATLGSRMAAMDVPNVLVHKIIPLVTDHYAHFTSVPHSHDSSYSQESKLNVARSFNKGKIHEGVTMAPPGSDTKPKEKDFLRKKIQAILPLLLSSQERSNRIVMSLLTEILACTVLTNVFAVLSEGDFFNQMIVKLVGANLQHRNQVKRLREALQQHTTQTSDHAIHCGDPTLLPSLKSPISPNTVGAWSTYIAKCASDDELSHLRRVLAEEKASLDPNNEAYPQDLSAISKICSVIPNSPETSPKFQNLETVLAEPKHAAVFREFLRGLKHEAEVDLWQDIELMRAPLEGTESSEIPLLLEFSNKDDIIKIYEKYFTTACFDISDSVKIPVSEYVKNDTSRDATLYQQARSALFELQSDLFTHMKNGHFKQFQNSSRFGDLESTSPRKMPGRRVTSTAFPPTRKHGVENGTNLENTPNLENDSRSSPSVSPVVIKAVESAFEKIMNTSSFEQENKLSTFNPLEELESTATLSNKSSQASLFGDTKLQSDTSMFMSHRNSSNRLSALFENNSDTESDSNSIISESLESDLSESRNMSNSELLLAAPGDLSLAEKIGVLDQDIENLSEQNEILLSLLKKAELTNNVAELKILKRSNASLEKEINSKELQKQQYIVQENDNSLYGKSKVKIQSCVFGKDENLTYVMYVIEVQKYSSSDANEIVAGWIVARRFSQFYKLNEYLKRKYPDVNEIKFPKKNVPYLKFQKAQQIETRKPLLEKYLQDLLIIPDVCSDPAFRSFLSSENFNVGKSPLNAKGRMDSIFSRFYQDLGNDPQLKEEKTPQVKRNEEMLLNIKEMERELKQFDELQRDVPEKVPFVKPISDLLLTIFDLSKSSWLRGRALLVILQQVLGSTIERTFTSQIESNLKQEWRIVDILNSLQNMLFPNGKFRESPEVRTKSEQLTTRKEAYTIMRIFMSETCSKIFGVKNTEYASNNILEMVQNDYLNKHLMFEILDELLLSLFPEMSGSTDNF
ncbi:hypothetical protein JCM33374_g2159 [Metschnikowia sp. JCM 33374]|nr:hypothetical protein JCM33374_g2159 [Metschnikowia sp. JCM 33374]